MTARKQETGWLRVNYPSSRSCLPGSRGPSEPVLQPDCPAGAPGVRSGAARRMRGGRGGAVDQMPIKP